MKILSWKRFCQPGAATLVFLGLASALAGSPRATGEGNKRPLRLEDLFASGRVSDPQVSPDGKQVAYVVANVELEENRSNSDIWLVPIDGGEPRKLTNSPKQDRHPRWSPDGKWIAFESNRGGSFQIYLISPDGGEARQLTTIATEAGNAVWSPKSTHLVFVSSVFPEFSEKPFAESDSLNKKRLDEAEASKVKAQVFTRLYYRHWDSWNDGRRQHLLVVPVSGGNPQDLTPGDRDAVPSSSTFSGGDDFDISPDGSELAYTATPQPAREEPWLTNHDIYRVKIAGGAPSQVTTNAAADATPRYSPDGRWLAYRAQRRAGFEADRWEIMVQERSSGAVSSVTAGLDASVEAFTWAPDSKALWFEYELSAGKVLGRVAVNGGAVTKQISGGVNSDTSLTPDGTRVVWLRQSLDRPPEVYSRKVDGGEPVALTHVNDGLFAQLDLPRPESVTVPGAGNVPVQMWLLRPPGFDASKRYPLVFWVHGGPQSAWLDSWSFRWNAELWAAQGYVLAMPNPRGSTGFGQTFVDQISGDWGGKVYEDLMACLGWVEQQPWVDKDRMGAAGASFGGYMMNWFQGHTDKFKVMVTHCGVFNFQTMYGTTDELWFDEWDHGKPWENADFEKWSPHRFAAKFRTPTLVVHNALDFRVPFQEGMALFTTLQRQGVPSKLLYFPDEGHWVLKPKNSELWHKTVFDWLGSYLHPGR